MTFVIVFTKIWETKDQVQEIFWLPKWSSLLELQSEQGKLFTNPGSSHLRDIYSCLDSSYPTPLMLASYFEMKRNPLSIQYSVQIAFLPLVELLFCESCFCIQCFHCANWILLGGGGSATLMGRSQVHVCYALWLTRSAPAKP